MIIISIFLLMYLMVTGIWSSHPNITRKILITFSTGAPECFVKDGKSFKGNKGHIVECVVPNSSETDDVINNYSVLIVDLSVEIRSKASIIGQKNSNTS